MNNRAGGTKRTGEGQGYMAGGTKSREGHGKTVNPHFQTIGYHTVSVHNFASKIISSEKHRKALFENVFYSLLNGNLTV